MPLCKKLHEASCPRDISNRAAVITQSLPRGDPRSRSPVARKAVDEELAALREETNIA